MAFVDWSGQAPEPLEVFNVGGWLTHGDLALEVKVVYIAVVEHRLIPASARNEWVVLKAKGTCFSGLLSCW